MVGLPPGNVIGQHWLKLRRSGIATNVEYPPGYLEESRAAQILVGNAICQILGTLVVLARVYSRLFITRIWKAEDWTLAVAWLFATGYSIGSYGQVAHGAGRHLAALTNLGDAVNSQKYAFANNLIIFFALVFPKLSICFAYLRIFYVDTPGRRLIQGLMVILVLLIVPFFIETLLSCKPIQVYWTELRPADKCLNDLSTLFVSGALNAAVDLALMSILIPKILHLRLGSRQKRLLLGIVLLGSLAVVAAVVRMVCVGTALANANATGQTPDVPWNTFDVTIWTATEIYVSLICAAAPGVKPLVSMLIPHLLGTTLGTQRSRGRTKGSQGYRSGPIELSVKMKGATHDTGSTLHKSFSATGLTAGSGPWIEVGRGTDEQSIRSMGDEERYHEQLIADRGIVKKSEIMVQMTKALDIPECAHMPKESV